MRTACLVVGTVFACLAPMVAQAQAGTGDPSNPAGAEAVHWSLIERPDRITGGIDHYLVADGVTSHPHQADRGATLLIRCDRNQPRRVFLDFGVVLFDGEVTEQMDGAPASSRTWGRLGHTMVLMDDTGASPPLNRGGIWNLSAAGAPSGTALRDGNIEKQTSEGVADQTMTGADALVGRLETVHQLVVMVQPNLPDPLSVSFNLNGLAAQLAEDGCPVQNSALASATAEVK